MYARIVPDIVNKYGLDVARIGAVQKGYRNESYPLELTTGESVNLLLYKREHGILDRITIADKVAAHASTQGLPVRTRYDNRLLMVGETYAGVYHYLQGTTISWESYTKRHIKLLGWGMADLHAAMEDLSGKKPLLSDELSTLVGRMRDYFSSRNIQQAIAAKLDIFVDPTIFDGYGALIERSRALDGQQYLHMDMVRGNALFGNPTPGGRWQMDDVELSGIIDFEKTAYGLPVCDAARTLAFLLVDCPKPADKIYKYFIDSGYRKRGHHDLRHIELLPYYVRFFLLHDFYKFLRHTPYESLQDNYHYSRTRQLLKDYGMISSKSQ